MLFLQGEYVIRMFTIVGNKEKLKVAGKNAGNFILPSVARIETTIKLLINNK